VDQRDARWPVEDSGPGAETRGTHHHGNHHSQCHQAPARSLHELALGCGPRPLGRLFGAAALEPSRQEGTLLPGELERPLLAPGLQLGQAGAGEQVVGVTAGRLPLVGRTHQRLVPLERSPVPFDPARQSVPFPEERLVGDLDRRLVGRGVAVEGEQPAAAELLEHLGERDRIEVEAGQIGERQAPS
jgi:hypothetical protein